MKHYHCVLSVNGSDSSGGAGVYADQKTFSALGCYGVFAITVISAQNTVMIEEIYPIPAEFVAKQLDTILGDFKISGIKIGVVYNKDNISAVADTITKYKTDNIILDPVMINKGGNRLLEDDAVEYMIRYLLPITEVITPNLYEASVLSGMHINDHRDIERAANKILTMGPKAVLIKGDSFRTEIVEDYFVSTDSNTPIWFSGRRINTENTHGSGCTLASAICAYRAKGNSLQRCVELAKHFIENSINEASNYSLGSGHGPVHQMFKYW